MIIDTDAQELPIQSKCIQFTLTPEGSIALRELTGRLQIEPDTLLQRALDLYVNTVEALTGPGRDHLHLAVYDPEHNVIHGYMFLKGINKELTGLLASNGRPV